MPLDLTKLEADREAAAVDKADLFDFYHKHWAELVAEVRRPLTEVYMLVATGLPHDVGEHYEAEIYDDTVYTSQEFASAHADLFKESIGKLHLRTLFETSIRILPIVSQ